MSIKLNELRLLKDMVNKITKGFSAIEHVVLTVKYTDGVIDTFGFGGDVSGVRTETQVQEDVMRLAKIGEQMLIDAAKCKQTYTDNSDCECEYEGCLASRHCWPEQHRGAK
jgi:hypothetical protein